MANEVLMTISQDERERAYQMSRYKYIVDTQSQMVEAKREGRAERDREIARNLKKMNLPAAHIAQVTGLTVSEIEEL